MRRDHLAGFDSIQLNVVDMQLRPAAFVCPIGAQMIIIIKIIIIISIASLLLYGNLQVMLNFCMFANGEAMRTRKVIHESS